MAVVDRYVDPNIAAGKVTSRAYNGGSLVVSVVGVAPVSDEDSHLSVYRLTKQSNPDFIPLDGFFFIDKEIFGTLEIAFGIWAPLTDAGVGNQDPIGGLGNWVLRDNEDFILGDLDRSLPKDVFGALPIADVKKPLFELAGHSFENRLSGYDIAFQKIGNGPSIQPVDIVYVMRFIKV